MYYFMFFFLYVLRLYFFCVLSRACFNDDTLHKNLSNQMQRSALKCAHFFDQDQSFFGMVRVINVLFQTQPDGRILKPRCWWVFNAYWTEGSAFLVKCDLIHQKKKVMIYHQNQPFHRQQMSWIKRKVTWTIPCWIHNSHLTPLKVNYFVE